MFFFYRSADHRNLHSFPTRRSSDLACVSHPITASMLYDLVACPHRVSMDLFADPAERDEVSPFVQLLWERDRKSTRLNSSHQIISYAVFCLKKKKHINRRVDVLLAH